MAITTDISIWQTAKNTWSWMVRQEDNGFPHKLIASGIGHPTHASAKAAAEKKMPRCAACGGALPDFDADCPECAKREAETKGWRKRFND